LKIVVQVKRHLGEDNDTQSVDQLRRAFNHYNAIAGLLVTSAEKIGRELQDEVDKLRTEGRPVEVLHGAELYRSILHVVASQAGDVP
jgi:hypothetical protein